MAEETHVAVAPGRSHIIERPRLTRLLDEATSRIILLVAPAGYGKTTLARQWLANRPHAWYRGTPASADVAALATGIADAASTILPGVSQRLRDRLRASASPASDVEVLAELLSDDFAAWPQGAWIAVDDHQFLTTAREAEAFLELLIEQSPAQFLIAARERPRWATARRLLYGDFFELGRSSLAMSREEAGEILAQRPAGEISGLFALAEGWPAVLGLVATTSSLELPDQSVPGALYDFFAEELFQPLSLELQANLAKLAFAPIVTPELASVLFGEESGRVLDEAVRLGFLTPQSRSTYDLHPLLRDFLERKLSTLPAVAQETSLIESTRFLIREHSWDEAFYLIERFSIEGTFVELVAEAMEYLLEDGRLSTLKRWLDSATKAQITSPVLDLAEAEIAFRGAAHEQAQALALQARDQLEDDHLLVARALTLAGESAYQLDQSELSLQLHEQALEHDPTPAVRRRATWGCFLAAIQLESNRAPAFLDDVAAVYGKSVDGTLRLANGKLLLSATDERIEDVIEAVRFAVHLVGKSRDAKARTSFLHVLGSSLAATANYERAIEMVERGKREAELFRLDFTVPFALVIETNARVGLRDFNAAAALLERCDALAAETKDVFLDISARTTRAKLLIAHGVFDEAAQTTYGDWAYSPGPAVFGELLGVRALAQACAQRNDEALATALDATRLTRGVEARTLGACARAIVSLDRRRSSGPSVDEAFAVAAQTQNYDSLVVALRGAPLLLEEGSRSGSRRDLLAKILARSRDRGLARSVGLSLPREVDPSDTELSPRERDVFDLLLHGRTNREIASTLYLSEATVKVHVRHILRKLGARSRTEAVLKGLNRRTRDA